MDLSDAILIPSANGQAEAESLLKKGLDHVAIMRKQDPSSAQARQVGAFLRFRLAQSIVPTGRVDDAIDLFRQGNAEMESLCVEFPWNRRYWEQARNFQQDTTRALQNAKRQEAAAESIERMVDWWQKIGSKLPDDPIPQAELQNCRTELIALLRSAGREERAKSLELASSSEAMVPEATHASRPRN